MRFEERRVNQITDDLERDKADFGVIPFSVWQEESYFEVSDCWYIRANKKS